MNDKAIEQERRFLVKDSSIIDGVDWKLITQAYLFADNGYAVRVRLVQHPSANGYVGETAFIGAKGPRLNGRRAEDEHLMNDLVLAKEIIGRAEHVIQKKRYSVIRDDATWDIDVFQGENHGLIIAELEGHGDWIWDVSRPVWVIREITHETEYNNDELAFRPIHRWAIEPPRDLPDEDPGWFDE